jgi:hypothetical protein
MAVNSVRKFFKLFSLTPLLLSASYILSIYFHNITELFLSALFIPIIFVILCSLIFTLMLSSFVKDKNKRTIFTFIFCVLFFSYGGVIDILSKFRLENILYSLIVLTWLVLGLILTFTLKKNSNFFSKRSILIATSALILPFLEIILSIYDLHYIFFPIWCLMLGGSFFILKKSSRDLSSLNKYIFLFSIFIFLIPSTQIINYQLSERFLRQNATSPMLLPIVEKSEFKNGLPDIYYIVPDSFTSTESIKKYLNYNEDSFVTNLESRGFYVPLDATSNYPKTFLSITSTLNMEYLDYLSTHYNSSDMTVVVPLLDNNNVVKFLKKLGYKYYQVGSWYDFTDDSPLADQNYTVESNNSLGDVDLFVFAILRSTMIGPFVGYFIPTAIKTNTVNGVRDRILYQFEVLPKIATMSGPKFVFVHIIAPHVPYVFDRQCEPIGNLVGKKLEDSANYLNQLICVSLKLENIVDEILVNSEKPPIILIQSDEGILFGKNEFEARRGWENASDLVLQKKFPIFSAYYLPGVDKSTLYSSITNVNSFRSIFNLYFSTDFPILPDKNYIFSNLNNLYQFEDVTARVKKVK